MDCDGLASWKTVPPSSWRRADGAGGAVAHGKRRPLVGASCRRSRPSRQSRRTRRPSDSCGASAEHGRRRTAPRGRSGTSLRLRASGFRASCVARRRGLVQPQPAPARDLARQRNCAGARGVAVEPTCGDDARRRSPCGRRRSDPREAGPAVRSNAENGLCGTQNSLVPCRDRRVHGHGDAVESRHRARSLAHRARGRSAYAHHRVGRGSTHRRRVSSGRDAPRFLPGTETADTAPRPRYAMAHT